MPDRQARSSVVRMTHTHEHEHDPAAGSGMPELLDLDAAALHDYWSSALDWVGQAVAGSGVSAPRILDLGAGSGAATVSLAERFPASELTAVDVSDEMVDHIRSKVRRRGLSGVTVVRADLDDEWPELGRLDLVWASMSLHHLADPERVLRDAFQALRLGGVVAVAEFDEPLQFLPHDLGLGDPGLERRCLDVMAEVHAHEVPELGADWPTRLRSAGFERVEERPFLIDLAPPSAPVTNRYALRWLQRMAQGLGDRLSATDRTTLATLIGDGPMSIQHRDDIHVRGTRTVTLARRPA
jgi:ubiquinone/menaquinone biosynthesis C-methylase UbiE